MRIVGRGGGAGPVAVVVVEGLRLGDVDVVVHVGVLLVRLPGAVRGLVVAHQAERLAPDRACRSQSSEKSVMRSVA